MFDGRMHAWIAAWNRLEAANEFKAELFKQKEFDAAKDRLPDTYWAMLVEANVAARLASADTVIGVGTGEYLEEQSRREREEEEHTEKQKLAVMDRDDALSCTCDFDKSQCPVHAQGDDIEDDDDE